MTDRTDLAWPDPGAPADEVGEWLHRTARRRIGLMAAVLPPNAVLLDWLDWRDLDHADRLRRTETVAKAMARYHNPKLAARLCDLCGRSYHGPAVYCSLVCAVRDA